jgi:hypothetical protein
VVQVVVQVVVLGTAARQVRYRLLPLFNLPCKYQPLAK